MDAHQAALYKVLELIGDQQILEITNIVPFGFREIIRRENIDIASFLDPSYTQKHPISLIHILLGCGINLQTLIDVINKAIQLCDRVFVMEHNRDSKDWDWNDDFTVGDHYLHNCLSFTEFSALSELYGWEIMREEVIQGNSSDDRNFVVELMGHLPTNDFNNKFSLLERLRIPLFHVLNPNPPPDTEESPLDICNRIYKGLPPNFRHLYDVYIGNAESPTKFLQYGPVLLENLGTTPHTLYASCGCFFSLQWIHLLRKSNIQKIVMFDINPYTVDFANSVFNLIKTYNSVPDFLTNYLLCDVENIKIANSRWADRIRIYLRNYPLYINSSKYIFQLILNGIPFSNGLRLYGFRNTADNSTEDLGTLYISPINDSFVSAHSLHVGLEGWLKSNETYRETQMFLKAIPIEFRVNNIMDLTPKPVDMVLSNNIFGMLSEGSRSQFLTNYPCRLCEI